MAIYALIGASASGKSTIERLLEKMGISRIISYTTRPKRNGEVNGLDYHFVSNAEFVDLVEDGFFSETAEYREWSYGLSIRDLDYISNDYLAVVTISGYLELFKQVLSEDHIKAIHIKVDERERITRLANRGDEVDEIIRRILADREDFKDVENICDFIVEEDNIEDALIEVYNIIRTE